MAQILTGPLFTFERVVKDEQNLGTDIKTQALWGMHVKKYSG